MKFLLALSLVLLLLPLGACTALSNWSGIQPLKSKQQLRQELDLIDSHLRFMRELTTAEYAQQIQLFDEAYARYQTLQDDSSALRYGLALTTSGHPRTDTGRGYTELVKLVEASGSLTPAELDLARVVMNEAAEVMILQARFTELSGVVSQTESAISRRGRSSRLNLQQAQKQLDEAQLEIAALRVELADAQAKLDAIKKIEVTSE